MGGKKDKLCSEGVHAPVCMCAGARGQPQVLFLKPYLLLGPNIFLGEGVRRHSVNVSDTGS